MYTWELLHDQNKPKKVKYGERIVSYLDILGFRELIKLRTPGEVSKILRVLAESVKPKSGEGSDKIEFVKFSDTIIRSVRGVIPSAAYLLYELKNLVYAQMALIPLGVAVRGVVTIGQIVQSWGVVFGPAVVRAYDLESEPGGVPRILIDSDALSRLSPPMTVEQLADFPGLIKRDGSKLFLDYLQACEDELNVPEQEYPAFLEIHRDFIRDSLTRYADNPKILSKYQWLRHYHNSTLHERFGSDIPQRLSI
jgi:hypothetical protein